MDISGAQQEKQLTAVKSCSVSKAALCFIGVVVLAIISIGLNIYWAVLLYRTKGLNIERKTISLTQSCEILSYNISLSQAAGVILNSIPDCAKTNSTASRLLTSCYTSTSTGQCLYCTDTDSSGSCIQASNQNPNDSIIQSVVKTWIKCMLNNLEVVEYGIQKCTQVGLEDYIIASIQNALSSGQIAGISVGSILGAGILCCCLKMCGKK